MLCVNNAADAAAAAAADTRDDNVSGDACQEKPSCTRPSSAASRQRGKRHCRCHWLDFTNAAAITSLSDLLTFNDQCAYINILTLSEHGWPWIEIQRQNEFNMLTFISVKSNLYRVY